MPNGNQRGSSYQRRARKRWLLRAFGDGVKAPCWECATIVNFETMVVDRIIPWNCGGTYRRTNIRVHCHPCSDRQGPLVRDLRKVKGDGMSSRSIIWDHAKVYGWMRTPNLHGNSWVDRFTKGGKVIAVEYAKTSERVVRAARDNAWFGPLIGTTRNAVLDALEGKENATVQN